MRKGNHGDGANLNNVDGTAGVTIAVSGTNYGNWFNGNYGDGLNILTKGAVTLTNVDANDNYSNGLVINNVGGTSAVIIKESGNGWRNWFTNNDQDGLHILSRGPVTVTFGNASDNGWTGVHIDASSGTGAVTLSGSIGRNAEVRSNGDDNDDNGITIHSQGNITLTRVEVRENYSTGAELINTAGTGMVTITDGYFENNYNGLIVESHGAVVWKNGSAVGNGNYGADIINSNLVTVGKPVTIANVSASNNHETGLWVGAKARSPSPTPKPATTRLTTM